MPLLYRSNNLSVIRHLDHLFCPLIMSQLLLPHSPLTSAFLEHGVQLAGDESTGNITKPVTLPKEEVTKRLISPAQLQQMFGIFLCFIVDLF